MRLFFCSCCQKRTLSCYSFYSLYSISFFLDQFGGDFGELSILVLLFDHGVPEGSIRVIGRMLLGVFFCCVPGAQELLPLEASEEFSIFIKVQLQSSLFSKVLGSQVAMDLDQVEEESHVVLCFPGLFLALLRRYLLLVHVYGVLLIQ